MKCPNIFGYATSELSQDAFLSWLLDWANPQYSEIDQSLNECAVFLVNEILGLDLQITTVQVRKQFHHIDVFAVVNSVYAIIIEDKTRTSEHDSQMTEYTQLITKDKDFKSIKSLTCVYYKSGNESLHSINRLAKHYFEKNNRLLVVLNRPRMLRILSNYNGNNAILNDYRDHLQRIENLTLSYAEKGYNFWGKYEWEGFYIALELKEPEIEWRYVPNQHGGFMGAWYKDLRIENDSYVKIQIEGNFNDYNKTKICIKICGNNKVPAEIVKTWKKHLITSINKVDGFHAIPPSRLGSGKTVTVAYMEPKSFFFNDKVNVDEVIQKINKLNLVLSDIIR